MEDLEKEENYRKHTSTNRLIVNTEFPPILFQPLAPRKLRPAPPRAIPSTAIEIQARVQAATRARLIVQQITQAVRILTPEQKRAVFLKMRHDRPLTPKDLAGTGFRLYSPPGESESLIIPRNAEDMNFQKMDRRMQKLQDETEQDKGLNLARSITSIEIADPKERLCEEFLTGYESLIDLPLFIYEVEIVSFKNRESTRVQQLSQNLTTLRNFISQSGAMHEHDDSQRNEGVIRAILSSSGAQFRQLVENPEWQHVISYFDERPKFETFSQRFRNFNIADTTLVPADPNAPKVCVIDTGVAAGNPLLSPVVDRQLSKSYLQNFNPLADPLGHGSGVASLVAYHTIDLSGGSTHKAYATIVSARITNDSGQMDVVEYSDDGQYRVLEAHLLSNTLEKIVREMQPHGIKIFVLSYNILNHHWSQANRRSISRKSWVARRIDSLVKDYDVVFIGITGNIHPSDLQDLGGHSAYPNHFNSPLCKILDPGQASLAVIVGSIAHSAIVTNPNAIAIAQEGHASPFTRSGPGFSDSVKPDFVEYGGNYVADPQTGLISSDLGTDVIMASGELSRVLQRNVGTSFAAPRIAFHAARILTDLNEIGITASSSLIRALLAVSANHIAPTLNPDIQLSVYGYGLPNGKAATDCAGHSVLLIYDGEQPVDKVILLPFQVPAGLSTFSRGEKIIRIAVATAPPVQTLGLENYLGIKLNFRLFRGDNDPDAIVRMMSLPEVEEPTADGAPPPRPPNVSDIPGNLRLTRRSNGSLQADTFSWHIHQAEYSQSPYILAISLKRADWCEINSVAIAAAVRIEDVTQRYTNLYADVQAAVLAEARARARSS